MDTWLFALVVLGVGALLAYTLDRMRQYRKFGRRGGEEGRMREGQARRERNRWLTYWFTGRFPTSEEERELEREVREEEAREQREKRGPDAKS